MAVGREGGNSRSSHASESNQQRSSSSDAAAAAAGQQCGSSSDAVAAAEAWCGTSGTSGGAVAQLTIAELNIRLAQVSEQQRQQRLGLGSKQQQRGQQQQQQQQAQWQGQQQRGQWRSGPASDPSTDYDDSASESSDVYRPSTLEAVQGTWESSNVYRASAPEAVQAADGALESEQSSGHSGEGTTLSSCTGSGLCCGSGKAVPTPDLPAQESESEPPSVAQQAQGGEGEEAAGGGNREGALVGADDPMKSRLGDVASWVATAGVASAAALPNPAPARASRSGLGLGSGSGLGIGLGPGSGAGRGLSGQPPLPKHQHQHQHQHQHRHQNQNQNQTSRTCTQLTLADAGLFLAPSWGTVPAPRTQHRQGAPAARSKPGAGAGAGAGACEGQRGSDSSAAGPDRAGDEEGEGVQGSSSSAPLQFWGGSPVSAAAVPSTRSPASRPSSRDRPGTASSFWSNYDLDEARGPLDGAEGL